MTIGTVLSMSAETWIAIGAAAIALLSMSAAFWQAQSAREQAKSARHQAALQKRALEDAAQPYVWMDIRPDDRDASFFHMILKNEGPTIAENVRVVVDPPLPASWRPTGVVGPTEQAFAALPPGRRMIWNLGLASEIVEADSVKEFDVTISVTGPHGEVPAHTYTLDLSPYGSNAKYALGTLSAVTRAISDLTKEVKNVNKKGGL